MAGNDMGSLASSKSSISSQDCTEAVAYATAAPHGAACHWPVQHRNNANDSFTLLCQIS